MTREAPVLEGLRVASPCEVPWDTMKGDDRVRHCGSCRLNVYDLSAMSRGEAEELVRGAEGRLCVRFFRRADGTVLTQDCPVGLERIRRRLRRIGNAIAAAFAAILFAGCGRSTDDGGGSERPLPTMGETVPAMGKPSVPIQGDVVQPDPIVGILLPPAPAEPK